MEITIQLTEGEWEIAGHRMIHATVLLNGEVYMTSHGTHAGDALRSLTGLVERF